MGWAVNMWRWAIFLYHAMIKSVFDFSFEFGV
jgi:hypothetical protein